jgi:pentatricopeptide repeat protein
MQREESESYDQYYPQQQRHARKRKQTRKHIGDTYSQLTDQLLDRHTIPVGSFSADHFQDSIKATHRWSSLHSSTGVETSLQLLDRLLEEVEFYAAAGQLLPTIRVQNLLEVIVNGWRISFSQNNNTSNNNNDSSTMTPYQMLEGLETYVDKHPELILNAKLHNMLLDAAANARSYSDGPIFCDALLQSIIYNAQQPSSSSPIPTPIGFGTVIHAWATSSHPDSPQNAQETLQHMFFLQKHWWPSLVPTVIHHNAVLNAWARAGHAERAESVFRTMYEDYASGNSSTPPDVVSFTTVLAALAKARSSSPSSLQENAERAEAILHLMLELYDSGDLDTKPDASKLQ